MLRGWNVEMGPVEEVLGTPLHPYSWKLKDSVPLADPDKTWQDSSDLTTLESEEYLLAGCRYAGRCPFAMDVCRQRAPKEVEIKNRMVKCFLFDEDEISAIEVKNNVDKIVNL